MAAEDELKDIKEILASIRDQNKIANSPSQSALDYKQYAAELKLARDELNMLDEGTGAYNRKLREVEKLTALTKNAMRDQRRESDALSLSIGGLTTAMDMLGNTLDTVIVKFGELVTEVMKEVKELDTLTIQFQAATGASAAMASNIGGLTDRLRVFGVSNKEAAETVDALYKNFTMFTQLNVDTQDKLGDTVALLGELGVSASTSAKLLESSFRTFGNSVEESNQLLVDMRGTARALQIPIEQLTSDFLEQESAFAILGDKGPEAFKKIAAASKSTGIAVSNLIDISDKFDDFDTAVSMAANLQAFGITLDPIAAQVEQGPLARVMMLKDAFIDAGYTAENFVKLSRQRQKAIANSMQTDPVTAIKILRGEFDELTDSVEETQYTFEDMKKEAFGLKGLDQVFNNMMSSFKRPIEEIQKAGRRTFEAFTPTIEMFEKYSADMIEKTEEFVKSNSELVGGLAIAYNMINLDVVQKSYDAFKGIMSFSGSLLSNMFTFKGLLLTIAGGGLFMIRGQLGDIIDTFKDQGIVAGLMALGSAFVDLFNDLKQKVIDAGFDGKKKKKLGGLVLDAAIFGFYRVIDYLQPIFIKMKAFFINMWNELEDDGTFDMIGDKIGQVFTRAMSKIPIIGGLFEMNTTGAMAGLGGAALGAKLGLAGGPLAPITVPLGALTGGLMGVNAGNDYQNAAEEMLGIVPEKPQRETFEEIEARLTKEQVAGRGDFVRRVGAARAEMNASLAEFQKTKGAQTIDEKTAVVMQKASKVMEVVEPRLAKVSTSLDSGLASLKKGLEEGLDNVVEKLGEMYNAQKNEHNKFTGEVVLDGKQVGDVVFTRLDSKIRGRTGR